MKHDDAQWRSHPSQLGAGPREEVSRATIRYRRPIRKQGDKKSRLMLYKNVINSAAVIPKFCGTPFQIRNPVQVGIPVCNWVSFCWRGRALVSESIFADGPH